MRKPQDKSDDASKPDKKNLGSDSFGVLSYAAFAFELSALF